MKILLAFRVLMYLRLDLIPRVSYWEHVYLFPLMQTDKIPCFLSSNFSKSHHRYIQHAVMV